MRRLLTGGVFVALAAGLWWGAASCGNGGGASGPVTPATSPAEPVPLFPADLGSDKIDVTGYPVPQQENYSLFVKKCSLCHTLARVVNAPMVDASTWTRFVKRMHGKNQDRVNGGPLLTGEEAKRVISFLVFDSRERKIKRADEFQMQQADLRNRFDLAVQERTKKKMEQDRGRSRESTPYVGDR